MGELILSTIVVSVNDKKIALKLKKARMDSGLSQEEVGTKVGVTWEMISRYENGRSSPLKHLSKFSTIYDKPVSYFVTDEKDAADSFNIDQLVQKLKDEGLGFSTSNRNVVQVLNHFSGKGIENDLSEADTFYEVSANLTDKYPNLFALKINKDFDIKVKDELRKDDIALFYPSNQANKDNIVIGYDGMSYKVMQYDPKGLDVPLAVLVTVMRKY